MPVLQIAAGCTGRLVWWAPALVYATALYPKSGEERQRLEWFALEVQRALDEAGGADELPREVERALDRGARSAAAARTKAEDRARRGQRAGALTLQLYRLAISPHPELVSLNNAARLVAQRAERRDEGGRATRHPMDPHHLEARTWRALRPAAPLWGAIYFAERAGEPWHRDLEALARLLATAEHLHIVLSAVKPRGHGPVLPPAEPWQAPPGLDLPLVAKVEVRALSKKEFQILGMD